MLIKLKCFSDLPELSVVVKHESHFFSLFIRDQRPFFRPANDDRQKEFITWSAYKCNTTEELPH